MLSSTWVRRIAAAILGALLLAFAFPRAGLAWSAPVGAAALFLAWEGATWKRAFVLGWFAGWIFFTISFWWWSVTIQTVVGPLAYAAVIAAAALEALSWGAAGACFAWYRGRCNPGIVPLAGACAFTVFEWLRSIGPIGVPFAQLGYTQAGTPLRVLAAFIGTIGVTFAICTFGAYLADAIERRTWRPFVASTACIVLATVLAWIAWPARHLPAPAIRVAAIQGNITQSLKWEPQSALLATERYQSMTREAIAHGRPQLIVWPETVIALANDGLNLHPELLRAFTQLAREGNTTLIAGSLQVKLNAFYNSLYFFTPPGLSAVYDKHQLVPFAEHFPGQAFLGWLPYIGELNGHLAEGQGDSVFPTSAGVTVGPLICWESAFGDLAYDEVRKGADVLVVSTDDAWFGTSSGPYQHAQIAQLRAIESGAYVIRAAATGISGVIAPDGTWQSHTVLETQDIAYGAVAKPVGSIFARIGPSTIFVALIVLAGALAFVRREHRG